MCRLSVQAARSRPARQRSLPAPRARPAGAARRPARAGLRRSRDAVDVFAIGRGAVLLAGAVQRSCVDQRTGRSGGGRNVSAGGADDAIVVLAGRGGIHRSDFVAAVVQLSQGPGAGAGAFGVVAVLVEALSASDVGGGGMHRNRRPASPRSRCVLVPCRVCRHLRERQPWSTTPADLAAVCAVHGIGPCAV